MFGCFMDRSSQHSRRTKQKLSARFSPTSLYINLVRAQLPCPVTGLIRARLPLQDHRSSGLNCRCGLLALALFASRETAGRADAMASALLGAGRFLDTTVWGFKFCRFVQASSQDAQDLIVKASTGF